MFGRRYSESQREFRDKVLLKRKVFRLRDRDIGVDAAAVPALAHAALGNGSRAEARIPKALAKLDYVAPVFNTCTQLDCRAFASMKVRHGRADVYPRLNSAWCSVADQVRRDRRAGP